MTMKGVATCPRCGRTLRSASSDGDTGTCAKHAMVKVRWLDGGGASRSHEWLYVPKPPPGGLS